MSPWLWVVAIAAGGVWFTLNREKKLSKNTFMRFVNFILFSLFILSLLHAPWGSWGYIASWLADLIGLFLGWIGAGLGGVPANGLASGLLVVLVIAVILDLWGRKPDKVARLGVGAIAVLAIVAGGGFGGAITDGVNGIGESSSSIVQDMSN